MKYSKYFPFRVHMEHGRPVIYNKADNPIYQWDAEQGFKKAVNTMHTWASRAFHLAAATPDPQIREYHLEHFEWELDNIETWLGYLREELQKQSGRLRVEERIALLRQVDGRTPEEAEAFRRKADELERKMEES